MQKYLANTQGQDLSEHLLAVAKRTVEVLGTLGLDEEIFNKLKQPAYLAGLLHDIGKVDTSFQGYISSKKTVKSYQDNLTVDAEEVREEKNWHNVFHQEISWLFIKKYLSVRQDPYSDIQESDLFSYAVFWHHPRHIDSKGRNSTNNIESVLKKDSNYASFWPQITDFANKLFPRADQNLFDSQKISLNNYANSISCSVPDYFTGGSNPDKDDIRTQAYQTLLTTCLIEADREVSSWEKEELLPYIEGVQNIPLKNNSSDFGNVVESEHPRSIEQNTLAEKLATNTISICGVDTGAGKTRIALLWKGKINSNRKLVIALPKRRQVDALFSSIKADISSCLTEGDRLSMQAVHGGRLQLRKDATLTEDNINKLGPQQMIDYLDSHVVLGDSINILVFDHLLSTFYKRARFNQFCEVLRSDLVFDEYHEFITIEKMQPSLLVILKIRSWLKNGGKTLLLSGTPDPAFNSFLDDMGELNLASFSRTELSPTNNNKRTYYFDDSIEGNGERNSEEDTLYSYNRVNDTQEAFINALKPSPSLAHSKFSEKDLVQKINYILSPDGKGKGNTTLTNTFSASMLQSSYDVSYRNASFTLSHPNVIGQYLGRVDRHGDKPDGWVRLVPEIKPEVFRADRMGFGEIYQYFEQHVRNILAEPKVWTHREATVEIWDKFWTAENIAIQKKELRDRFIRAAEEINENYPIKTGKKSKNKKSGGSLFRGSSYYAAAAIYDNNANPVGLTSSDEVVTVSSVWEINPLKNAMIAISVPSNKNMLNQYNLGIHTGDFPISKDPNRFKHYHGRDPELPFYFSHHSPNDIGKNIDNALAVHLGKEYSVYNKDLGLVKLEDVTTYAKKFIK